VDHRQPRAGYHTLAAVLGGAAFLQAACMLPTLAAVGVPDVSPSPPYEAERRALVAAVNAARELVGAPALRYDPLLQRIGDIHCRRLLAEGIWGHFALDGVPPYARYLLAGGHGFHRENAASHSSSVGVSPDQVGPIVEGSLDRMLAERPPHDGHRRTLLDPLATHIGIGLAVGDGEVRLTEEVATELAVGWNDAPPVARPRTALTVAGQLAAPWRVAAVELLRQPLPRPLMRARALGIVAYGYPPRRSITYASGPPELLGVAGRLETRSGGRFAYRWTTGPGPGLEVVVIWAQREAGAHTLVPVAASATAVTPDGAAPAALAPWIALRQR
jgi:uncharacterized protein YkwD